MNPLQKLVYFGLKVLLIPMLSISGLLYMFYRYESNGQIKSLDIDGLGGIASVHTLIALLMIAFVIVHLYLITTGTTVFSNLKAMLTGYEELEHEDEESEEKKETNE